MEHSRPQIAKAILNRTNSVGATTITDFKTHYRGIVTRLSFGIKTDMQANETE
jgi:hypothetical protein